MTKDELIGLAETHSVEVDKRWGADKLRSTLVEAGVIESEPMIDVLLTRDYWPEAGRDRLRAGETVSVSIGTAMDLVTGGKAQRTDPLR